MDFPVPNTQTILSYHTRAFGETQETLDGEALDAITYAGITDLDRLINAKGPSGENTPLDPKIEGPGGGKFALAGILIRIQGDPDGTNPTYRQAKNIVIGIQLAAHNKGYYEEAEIFASETLDDIGTFAKVDLIHQRADDKQVATLQLDSTS